MNAAGNTISPKDLTVNGNIINTNLQNELNNRSLTNHTHNISSITNLQNELNNRSLLNHTHPNIHDQTDITRIMNSQQTASFILERNWKYLGNGTIEGARLLILPVDRSQSSSGYIEFKSTLGSWSRIRNLNGTEPDTTIPILRNIILSFHTMLKDDRLALIDLPFWVPKN